MLIKTLLPFLLPAAAPGDKTAGKTKILHMNHPSSKITFCKKLQVSANGTLSKVGALINDE